jgi:hypothetical protein
MQDYTLERLTEIIESEYSSELERETAIAELLVRVSVLSKGGDRPPTPPPNP